MKKKKIFVALLSILAIGICGFFGLRQYARSLPPRGEPIVHTVSGGLGSLISDETNFFIATSELIVKGKLTGETDGPQFIESGMPFVSEGFHVTKVYKGDCKPGDDIEFAHIGGEVSLHKMLRDAEKLGIKNAAYNQIGGYPKGLKSWELKQDEIFKLNADVEAQYALPSDEEEYVLFLSSYPKWNTYFLGVGAQNYNIRKVNERGQILNPFTDNYEAVNWEVASKLTREDVLPGFVSDYDAHPEWFEDLE